MPKKPPRKNLKPPGKCIFCSDGAVPGNPMTGEHLWSDWMDKAKLLPRGGRYFEFRNTFRRRHENATSVFRRTRQGTANTKRIKVVCQNCNSGWMGTLETEVQPFLTPLIKGEPITLDAQMRQTIVEWIVMKVLVAEHNYYLGHPADPIFDLTARAAFMQSRAVPTGIRIWIGRQHGTKWITGFHRHATGLGFTATLPPQEPPTRTKNAQAVTWGIGRLLIYFNAFTSPDVYTRVELSNIEPCLILWPLAANNVVWPPMRSLGDADIDFLCELLEGFINSSDVLRLDEST